MLTRLTLLALLAAAAVAAQAAPDAAPPAAVRVEAGRVPAPNADDLRALRGEYLFPDGRVLAVERATRKLVVSYDGGPGEALHTLSATEFASADGRMRLAFETLPNGLVQTVTLTLRRGGAGLAASAAAQPPRS